MGRMILGKRELRNRVLMGGRRILDGWKAIATYLGRTGKTCRNWEHELGLPVHRLDDSTSAHVFAYTDELDRWRKEKLETAKNHPAGGRPRFSRNAPSRLAGASVALLVLIAAGAVMLWKFNPFLRTPAAPKIENSIAVVSFINQTGDPAYDNLQVVIPNLLITNLENTGLFYVTTWERMRDVLKQVGVKPARLIDADLGFEVCRREGTKAIAIGSFTKVGDVFATDVKVLDAETKQLLTSANDKGKGIDSILETQIDTLSRKMSLGWGVDKVKIEAAGMNIKGITTRFLEAYEYFLKGKEAFSVEDWAKVKEHTEKALEIDPTFVMAYVHLAWASFCLGDTKAGNGALDKAMAISDRTSAKDRLYLEGIHAWAKGDLEKSRIIVGKLIRKYPKEKWAFHFLGDLYHFEYGDNARASDQYKKWLELDPRDTFALSHLLMAATSQRDFNKAQEYIKMRQAIGPPDTSSLHWQAVMYRKMGLLDKAISTNKKALAINPDFWQSVHNIIALYALEEEYEESMRWADEFVSRASSVGLKSGAYATRGFYHYWRGELAAALDDLGEAEKLAEEVENWSQRVFVAERKGMAYVALSEPELSRECFADVVRIAEEHLSKDLPARKAQAALWLGYLSLKQGHIDQAKARLSELESCLPSYDLRTQNELSFWRDLLQGEVLLAQGSLDEALPISQKACQPGSLFLDESAYFRDLLARVYAQRGEIGKAISEYERLLKPGVSADAPASEYEHPLDLGAGADVVFLIHPLYHHRLGILYERAGEIAKARVRYEKFLDLWKNADPGRPEVADARMRLAALEGR
jgi:tetratricopeptide (TPR) repeat protein